LGCQIGIRHERGIEIGNCGNFTGRLTKPEDEFFLVVLRRIEDLQDEGLERRIPPDDNLSRSPGDMVSVHNLISFQ